MKIPLWLIVFIIGVVVFAFCESVAWLIGRLRSHPVDDCPTTLPTPTDEHYAANMEAPPEKKTISLEQCEEIASIVRQAGLIPIPIERVPTATKLDEYDYAVLLRMVDELRKRLANASGALQSAERELKLTRQRLDESADWLNKLDKLMTKIAAKIGNLDLHEENER